MRRRSSAVVCVLAFAATCALLGAGVQAQTTSPWPWYWTNLGPTRMSAANGAINVPLPHPTNPDIAYVGTVNGGIWRTNNALATGNAQTWTPLTDYTSTLSIASMDWDYSDATGSTLIAGVGSRSSFYMKGGPNTGLIYTNSSFSTYRHSIGGSTFGGVFGVGAIRNYFLACGSNGIYYSSNWGSSFIRTQTGSCWSMVADRRNEGHFYAALKNNPPTVVWTSNYGLNWTVAANNNTIVLKPGDETKFVQLNVALHSSAGGQVLWVAGVSSNDFLTLLRGVKSGSTFTWQRLNHTCLSDSGSYIPDLLPGDQGSWHFAFAADPAQNNVAYVAGDRSTEWVCDSTLSGPACRQLSGAGSKSYTSIHSDIRGMMIDAGGDLLTTGDGGIYRRKSPQPAVRKLGDWSTLTGNIVVTECFSGVKTSAVTFCGSQDNGNPNVATPGGTWMVTGGDGSHLQYVADPANNRHYVWNAYQYLGGLHRRAYNNAGVVQNYAYATLPYSVGFYQEYAVSAYNSSLMIIYSSWWKTFLSNDTASTWVNMTRLFPVSTSDLTINHVLFGLRLSGVNNDWAHYVFTNTRVLKRLSAAGPYENVPWPPANATGCQPKRAAADPDDGNFIAILCGDGKVVYTTNGGASTSSWTVLPTIGGTDWGRLVVLPVRPAFNPTRTIVASCSSCRVKYYTLGQSTNAFISVNGTTNALHMDLRWDETTSSLVVATLGRGLWGISPPPIAAPQAPVAPVPVAAPKAAPIAAPKAAPVAATPKAATPVASPKAASPVVAGAPVRPPVAVPVAPPVRPVSILTIAIETNDTLSSVKQASLMNYIAEWFGSRYSINPADLVVSFSDMGNLTYMIGIDFGALVDTIPDFELMMTDAEFRNQLRINMNADLTSNTGQDGGLKYEIKNIFVTTQMPPSASGGAPSGGASQPSAPAADGAPGSAVQSSASQQVATLTIAIFSAIIATLVL